MTDFWEEETDVGLVRFEHACPACGERRIDELAWIDDEQVHCQTCGTIYDPNAGDRPTE
jgi:rubredoxin